MKSKAILLAAALAIVIPFGVANAKDNEQTSVREVENVQNVVESETNKDTERMSQATQERAEQAKEAAKLKVEQAKEAAQERKIALKQDRCEARKEKLSEKLPQLSKGVESVKAALDAKLAKVQSIKESGKLNADNYDDLLAKVITAKGAAEGAISAISTPTATIDCNNNTLGVQLDTFRTTVNEAKAALKDYRTALVNVISALNAAADKAEASEQQSGTVNTANTTKEGVN